MSELGFERRPHVSHSELTSGHDVTHLLSTINQTHNLKQSKADQILRLLNDQNKLNDDDDDIEDIDLEYNQIREEKVPFDSDTLTDSSSDGETEVTIAEPEETINCDDVIVSNKNNQRSKEGRSKTSIGFYGFERNDSGIHLEHESDTMGERGGWFDTRDLSVRPKSSYVRRGQLYRKNTEVNMNTNAMEVDRTEEITHRSVSARMRPKSRLGRESVRLEKKIEMVEATPVVQPEVPVKEEVVSKAAGTGSLYRRFERTRTPLPRRSSKRTKGFCEDDNNTSPSTGSSANQGHVSTENARAHNVHPVYSDMETGVQDISSVQISTNTQSNVTRTPVQSLSNTTVPRNSPAMSYQHRQYQTSQPARADTYTRHQQQQDAHMVEQPLHHQQQQQQHQQQYQQQQQQNLQTPSYANIHRSDTVLTVASSIRQDTVNDNNSIAVKRTQSNSSYRPKNPEPISTRPMGRPDVRPGTRQRRLTRRYMQQSQNPINAVRPTSESVILARQKTEKNLLNKQKDNRPQSEKIPVTNTKNILSVRNNPTQGPQTNINMSKEGITQSSHVGAAGFRGYDPGQRLKSSSRSRDIPADLTLPRSGMFGTRKNLAALMKLPPLEESLAAKKKERGLTLAQRETCV